MCILPDIQCVLLSTAYKPSTCNVRAFSHLSSFSIPVQCVDTAVCCPHCNKQKQSHSHFHLVSMSRNCLTVKFFISAQFIMSTVYKFLFFSIHATSTTQPESKIHETPEPIWTFQRKNFLSLPVCSVNPIIFICFYIVRGSIYRQFGRN